MAMQTHKCHTLLSLPSLITLSRSCCWLFLLLSSFLLGSGVKALAAGVSAASDVHGAPAAMSWDNVVDLNEDFRILWTIINQDITFEIQARASGYVGLGFSADGSPAGADMAVGWVTKGHTYFQDRYVKPDGDVEPLMDPSQDYILLAGYENATHTVIRFQRKLDTCDSEHDLAITNDTMRIMYMYSDEDPMPGAMTTGALPNHAEAWRPHRSLLLTQRPQVGSYRRTHVRTLELRNQNVELPYGDDTYTWCRTFKLNNFDRKHHVIRYEPIYDSSWSIYYLQQVTLYECDNRDEGRLEQVANTAGGQCGGALEVSPTCNSIAAAWTRGSEGFEFPIEAGYPMTSRDAKYYVLETQYSNNLNPDFDQFLSRKLTDNSGLRLYITSDVRRYDAGVMSVGVHANWRHIIPPGQKHVKSEGQCIEECTKSSFPAQGINIFAVMMRTHRIGREIKLRQIRGSEELPPIAQDSNIDSNYQEFRRLTHSVNSLPGDRLVAECIYDSSSRKAITLGGLTMKEESCTVLTLYYPRQKRLTTCHSLPSLPTVLHSLGIEQLAMSSNPIVISLPSSLAGMTLETRLLSYDWKNQFDKFQDATLHGSFKPICMSFNGEAIPISDSSTGYSINLTKPYKAPSRCTAKRLFTSDTVPQVELPLFPEIQTNHLVEVSARNSRSSLIETLALSGAESAAGSMTIFFRRYSVAWVFLLLLLLNS